MTATRGELIGGRYRLDEPVGQGGMGRVWRGHDVVLDRAVAVKEVVLPAELEQSEREMMLQRVLREARAAARLNHPGIITVHDVVEHQGAPVIVMEFIDGTSLAAEIRTQGRLAPPRVATIGVAILEALSAAHAAGVVHRDLKPDNILLTGGRVVLTDFGIASMASATQLLTSTGVLLGTPAYMAPEQLDGKPASPASDLWSLGATLYTAVEGERPFSGNTLSALYVGILTKEPRPAVYAGPLAPVLTGLLAKDPDRRLTAAQVAQALGAAAPPAPPVATPVATPTLPSAVPPAVPPIAQQSPYAAAATPPVGAAWSAAPPVGYGPPAQYGPPAAYGPPAQYGPPAAYGPPAPYGTPMPYGSPNPVGAPTPVGTPAPNASRRRNVALLGAGLVVAVALSVGTVALWPTDTPTTGASGQGTGGTPSTPSTTNPSGSPSSSPSGAATGGPYTITPKANPGSWKNEPAMTINTAASYTATIRLGQGTVALKLDAAGAPHTVNSFVFLTKQHFFDGIYCHRITTAGIYVLQCGDPTGTGSGGPGYSFKDENLTAPAIKGGTYPAGTLAMANAGPNTNGSQFFLVYKDSALPPNYTPFGTVTGGMDVLNAIAAKGSDNANGSGDGKPTDPVVMNIVTVASN